MREVIHLLRNHRLNTPAMNATVMDRACETLDTYRSVVVELLALLSWLRGKNPLPSVADFDRLERIARELIDVEERVIAHQTVDVIGTSDTPPIARPLADPLSGNALAESMPDYKICPRCGDRTPKIVHLRRRPKAGLECVACRYEYPFPHRWG
jgi:hypothetical protein